VFLYLLAYLFKKTKNVIKVVFIHFVFIYILLNLQTYETYVLLLIVIFNIACKYILR